MRLGHLQALQGQRREQVQAMAKSLQEHGKEVETFIVPGGTHFFTEQQNALTRRKLFDFLRRHLNRS